MRTLIFAIMFAGSAFVFPATAQQAAPSPQTSEKMHPDADKAVKTDQQQMQRDADKDIKTRNSGQKAVKTDQPQMQRDADKDIKTRNSGPDSDQSTGSAGQTDKPR